MFCVVFFSHSASLRCATNDMWTELEDCRPADRLSLILREQRVRFRGKKNKYRAACGRYGPRGVKRLLVHVPLEIPLGTDVFNPMPCNPLLFREVVVPVVAEVVDLRRLLLLYFDSVCLTGAARRRRGSPRSRGRALEEE